MNLWTVGASVQGHCEFLRQEFPGIEPLQVVVAFDVRGFLDSSKVYNPELPNPVLGLSSIAGLTEGGRWESNPHNPGSQPGPAAALGSATVSPAGVEPA